MKEMKIYPLIKSFMSLQNFKKGIFLSRFDEESKGSFTLATFVGDNASDNASNSDTLVLALSDISIGKVCAIMPATVPANYLPWPPWVARQKIEMILSVSCPPRWPRWPS